MTNLSKTVNNEQGFTLIELIAAVTILAIIIAPVLGLFSASFKNNRTAKEKTVAVALAQAKMEELKAMHYQELLAVAGEAMEEVLLEEGLKYTRFTEIHEKEPKLLEIKVVVYWDKGEVDLTTLKGDTQP